MKERPILFSGAMVRALLDGSKTQTRRIVKPHPIENSRFDGGAYISQPKRTFSPQQVSGDISVKSNYIHLCCPYGQPGDRLWVRETGRGEELDSGIDGVRYQADDFFRPIDDTRSAAINWLKLNTYARLSAEGSALGSQLGRWVPSIHMPRWASRITLEVTGVRVERLQDISEADARAEGVTIEEQHTTGYCAGEYLPPSIRAYRDLWESINGAGSWDANPWVWVIEFRRIEQDRRAA